MTDMEREMLRNCVIGRIQEIDKIIRAGGNGVDNSFWETSKRQHWELLDSFDRLYFSGANVPELRMVDHRQ